LRKGEKSLMGGFKKGRGRERPGRAENSANEKPKTTTTNEKGNYTRKKSRRARDALAVVTRRSAQTNRKKTAKRKERDPGTAKPG